MHPITRRKALLASLSAPFVIGAASAVQAQAVKPAAKPAVAPSAFARGLSQRFRLGTFEITTLLAGQSEQPNPKSLFAVNVPENQYVETAKAAFLPLDRAVGSFTPVLVDTGREKVLFDCGLAPEGVLAALGQAGIAPQAIDVVVLTHMHGDHIGGLMMADGATPVFPRARYVTGQIEFDYWTVNPSEIFTKNMKPLAEQTSFVEDGGVVVPGITALAAFGHTPGHMAWMIESAGQLLVLTGDCANHYVFSLEHPNWEVRFDMDKAMAAATRQRIFGMIAADRLPFIGYHMPFPALGYVEAKGAGFRFVPHSYQLTAL